MVGMSDAVGHNGMEDQVRAGFAQVTMLLEDASFLAIDGQARDQSMSVQFRRLRSLHDYTERLKTLLDELEAIMLR